MSESTVDAPGENRAGETPATDGLGDVENGGNVTVTEEGTELERTIGLVGGLAIGVGTMVGAGIFVFPGIAAGEAGPAAAVSYAIGMVIALLVALPASELATAMPKSGGGYYFVSRSLGALAGTVVGISLWLGLVFASSFYLVGFGSYAGEVLARLGITLSVSPEVGLGLLFGAALTALSFTGTENTAKLQNYVVAILLVILSVFLAYGGADAFGVFGKATTPETFMPFGATPVITTAALVFTSYLGFAQVATVAGEIKNPGRNLPLAMVGSVLIVGVFYVVTIFVATSLMGSAKLASYGETAMVEVGAQFTGAGGLAGTLGALAIIVGGLLATVSSANASIMSSSRAVFALSRDALLPDKAGEINLKYGTPHVALTMAGVPTLLLVASGQTAVLAEVASFLHLIMYGLICVALIQMRRNEPEWYDPDFRVPAYPVVASVGAIASFGLIAFMQPLSQIIGVVLMVVAAAWYFYYARDVSLKGAL